MELVLHTNKNFSFFNEDEIVMCNGQTAWDSWEDFCNDYINERNPVANFYLFEMAFNTHPDSNKIAHSHKLQTV